MIYSGTFVKLVDSKSGERKDGKGTWQMATFLVRDKDINLFEVWGEEVDRVRELKDGDNCVSFHLGFCAIRHLFKCIALLTW